jgi:hypothetical protein
MADDWYDHVEDFGAHVFNAVKKGGSKKGAKKHHLNLAEKLDILQESRTKNNHTYLAEKFNVPHPTVVRILNEQEKFLQAIDKGADKSIKHLHPTKFGLDDALCRWIRDMRSRDVPVSGDLLRVSLIFSFHNATFIGKRSKVGKFAWL